MVDNFDSDSMAGFLQPGDDTTEKAQAYRRLLAAEQALQVAIQERRAAAETFATTTLHCKSNSTPSEDPPRALPAPPSLQRLAALADAYDRSELDEARPEHEMHGFDPARVVLVSGRGGRALLTLADAIAARKALGR